MNQHPPPLPGQPIIPPPPGMSWFGDVKVAGTRHEGREDILRMLGRPDPRLAWHLIPEREPGNPHDSKAIAVIAVQGTRRLHLGYLPKQVAASLSTYKRIGIVPRSLDPQGRYLYVDVFHSEKQRSGCLPLLLLALIPVAWGFLNLR